MSTFSQFLFHIGNNKQRLRTRDIPDADSLIQRSGHDDVLRGVELGTHYVMIMPGQYADTSATLPVPDPYGLVVRRAEDPGILLMEHRGPDVVQVT